MHLSVFLLIWVSSDGSCFCRMIWNIFFYGEAAWKSLKYCNFAAYEKYP